MRAILAVLILSAPAAAEPVSVRLERIDTEGTCGASFLAADLVVTAAHCARLDPSLHRLRVPGRPPIAVAEVLRHPGYPISSDGTLLRFRFDLALLRLGRPSAGAAALPLGGPPVVGESLAVETWRRGERMPARRACPVLEGPPGLALLRCAVDRGHSGAPVIRETADGPELVAVVVASVDAGAGRAALAAPLRPAIAGFAPLRDADRPRRPTRP